MIARRIFLAGAAAPLFAFKVEGLKIGVGSGALGRRDKPVEAIEAARRLGFDAIELIIGPAGPNGRMFLEDPALLAACAAEAKKQKLPVSATVLNILHTEHLKNNESAKKRVIDGIALTRRLNSKVMLIPFFNQATPQTAEEKERTAAVVKELAPHAEKAGVVLGFENTLTAEDNARILDRVGSPAFKVFYDVGNTTRAGYDIFKEIRFLGRDRICTFHLKDQGYLGEGKIDFRKVFDVIGEIGFKGYATFETNSPSKNVEADQARNLAFVRKLLG